jgi:thioesterase III
LIDREERTSKIVSGMEAKLFLYEVLIRESHLDTFGHVNNASYLELLEEARWEMGTQNGYGMHEVIASNRGPIVLELRLKFKKELKLREKVTISSRCTGLRKKLWTLEQEVRNQAGELCSIAELTMGLFDTLQRRLVSPDEKWLRSMGVSPGTKATLV